MVIISELFYTELPISSLESDPRRKLAGIRNQTNIKGGRLRQQMPADEAGTGESGGDRSLFTAHAAVMAGRQLDLTTQALPQQQQIQQQVSKEFCVSRISPFLPRRALFLTHGFSALWLPPE